MNFYQFEEEEDSVEEKFQWGGEEGTIYLIDVDSKLGNSFVFLKRCLKCINTILCKKIRTREAGLNSVVFYNTKNANNSFDFPHLFILQNLDNSCAERILELESLMEDVNSFEDIIGSDSDSSLYDVFWVCRNIFNSQKKKMATKSILLFTANDNPHTDDHKIRQAYKGAKDLFEANIYVEILPLTESFDGNKFYKDLLDESFEGNSTRKMAKISNPTENLEEMLETHFAKKHRTTAKLSFTLAPNYELAVKVFTYIRKENLPSSTKLYKVANEEVVFQRKETLETGELLLPSDIIKYQTYCNQRIKFTQDELRHVNITYEPGIKLIGFKSISTFKPFHYIKPANILYPDEESIKGSTKIFACLHERCLMRKIYPVVQFQARENSSTAWAFLLPQKEEIDDSNKQIRPPVFFVCYLPFSDDIRNVEIERRDTAESKQVDAAKNIINNFNYNFNPVTYENPVIKTHWQLIEAYALNRSSLDEIEDSTVPNFKEIEDKTGPLVDLFKALVFSPDYDPHKVFKKRPMDNYYPDAKRMKPIADSMSVEVLAKLNKVDNLNMDVLKRWLHSRGKKTYGKKKHQLVQDIYEELAI